MTPAVERWMSSRVPDLPVLLRGDFWVHRPGGDAFEIYAGYHDAEDIEWSDVRPLVSGAGEPVEADWLAAEAAQERRRQTSLQLYKLDRVMKARARFAKEMAEIERLS